MKEEYGREGGTKDGSGKREGREGGKRERGDEQAVGFWGWGK
jgi:hypothetical protein